MAMENSNQQADRTTPGLATVTHKSWVWYYCCRTLNCFLSVYLLVWLIGYYWPFDPNSRTPEEWMEVRKNRNTIIFHAFKWCMAIECCRSSVWLCCAFPTSFRTLRLCFHVLHPSSAVSDIWRRAAKDTHTRCERLAFQLDCSYQRMLEMQEEKEHVLSEIKRFSQSEEDRLTRTLQMFRGQEGDTELAPRIEDPYSEIESSVSRLLSENRALRETIKSSPGDSCDIDTLFMVIDNDRPSDEQLASTLNARSRPVAERILKMKERIRVLHYAESDLLFQKRAMQEEGWETRVVYDDDYYIRMLPPEIRSKLSSPDKIIPAHRPAVTKVGDLQRHVSHLRHEEKTLNLDAEALYDKMHPWGCPVDVECYIHREAKAEEFVCRWIKVRTRLEQVTDAYRHAGRELVNLIGPTQSPGSPVEAGQPPDLTATSTETEQLRAELELKDHTIKDLEARYNAMENTNSVMAVKLRSLLNSSEPGDPPQVSIKYRPDRSRKTGVSCILSSGGSAGEHKEKDEVDSTTSL